MSEPASPPPAFEPQLPFTFGNYELLAEIGRGGMGVIYRARQCCLDRICAVKMLRPESPRRSPDAEDSLAAEAAAAARLDHPNIVGIYEVGREHGQLYFSMEFVDGEDLARYVRSRFLDGPGIARLVRKIADAIAYAHERGILHHDLKPANVVMDSRDEPQVTDFGLARRVDEARRTDPSRGAGTPNYLSPEQASARFGEPGIATDVFGLGAILYFLLTDRAPFQGFTAEDTLRAVLETDPVPPGRIRPGVAADLETICLKCLQKQPDRRYASAREVSEELSRHLEDRPIRARPAGIVERTRKWCRRHPAVAGLASVVALLLVLIAAGTSAAALRIHQARGRAEASERETRHHLYNADLLLASAAYATGNDLQLRELLGRHRPAPGSPDLRGWEWHFLEQAAAGDVERTLGRLDDLVVQVHAAPDGTWVAASDNSGTIRTWDPATGRELASRRIHEVGAAIFAVSADGSRLVAGARPPNAQDTTAIVLRLPSLEEITRFNLPGRRVPVGFGPAPDRVWFAGTEGWLACHLPEGTSITNLPIPTLRRHRTAALSPDARWGAVASEDGTIHFWDLESVRPLGQVAGHALQPVWGQAVFFLEFSPDGKSLASAGGDGRVRIWDTETFQLRREITGHADLITLAVFSPDRRRVLSLGKDRFLQITPVTPGAPSLRLRGAGSVQMAGAFLGSEGRVVTGGIDGSVDLWRATPREPTLWQRALPEGTSAPVPLEDGVHVACLLADGGTEVRRLDDARPLLRLEARAGIVATAYERTADGRSLAATLSGEGVLRLVREPGAHTTETRIPLPAGARFRNSSQMGISSDLRHLALADTPLGLWIFETEPLRQAARSEARARNLVFSPRGTRLVSTELPSTIRVWTFPADGRPPKELSHPQVSIAGFSADDHQLASVALDGTVHLWDMDSGQRIASLSSTVGDLSAVTWAPDGTRLYAGTLGGALAVWDLGTLRQTFFHRGHLQPIVALSARADGSLVTFAPDGIQTWPVRPSGDVLR